ncbi:MAG: thiamine pyrophosphate-binding protein [Candidatus Rokuibacteriota bacterium]|nr:MAG: thiamine pyrophosphate-binding protein [Candidatus Rokubacteria bacterium]
MSRTVRDAAFDVFRRRGLTTLFANPGSTEVPFLGGLPDDLRFVLGLHEGAVVGLATGWAIGRGEPALVLLHTTAGLGTGVAALATARVNRAPLVVIVGQQDRRHLAYEPFLAGRLAGLAGEYPVSFEQPVQAQDVPAAIERAFHAAAAARGPALVTVPMDDWAAPADEEREPAATVGSVLRASAVAPAAIESLVGVLGGARAPALVVGAGADDPETWAALVELAERLVAPVFQESFGARAGFPQDHRLFAGVLPADRGRLRDRLAPYDALLVVGAPAFRQTGYAPGRFLERGTRLALVADDPDEVHRSPAEVALLAAPAAVCRELARRLPARDLVPPEALRRPASPPPPEPGEQLRASHVLAALAERLPRDAVVVEEAPVDRPEIHERLPAREPLGYLSAAMGGLGFAVPAAAGLRMALPHRPIVAVVGDGAAIYGVPALWSAAHYRVGAVFVVLSNGRYAVLDRLAELHGAPGPWPSFEEVEVAAIARGFGCPARRIETHGELVASLDEVVPTLGDREEPFLLDVVIAPTQHFVP